MKLSELITESRTDALEIPATIIFGDKRYEKEGDLDKTQDFIRKSLGPMADTAMYGKIMIHPSKDQKKMHIVSRTAGRGKDFGKVKIFFQKEIPMKEVHGRYFVNRTLFMRTVIDAMEAARNNDVHYQNYEGELEESLAGPKRIYLPDGVPADRFLKQKMGPLADTQAASQIKIHDLNFHLAFDAGEGKQINCRIHRAKDRRRFVFYSEFAEKFTDALSLTDPENILIGIDGGRQIVHSSVTKKLGLPDSRLHFMTTDNPEELTIFSHGRTAKIKVQRVDQLIMTDRESLIRTVKELNSP